MPYHEVPTGLFVLDEAQWKAYGETLQLPPDER
jgi:hypothetical protein